MSDPITIEADLGSIQSTYRRLSFKFCASTNGKPCMRLMMYDSSTRKGNLIIMDIGQIGIDGLRVALDKAEAYLAKSPADGKSLVP